ncbi:tyrosinase-like [Gadus macrocephalus]|uniref:tyrosinase-like n=1 Tax=Gadus macrocephalus TaxID=80720 RepID=UPI0028CB3877|nr:tyrosinase-like [Gadus macrocephalus]
MWSLFLIIATFVVCFAPSFQQFPRRCANSEALLSKECCPSWDGDGSACGASSGRGFCQDVQAPTQPDGPQYPFSGVDDREKWPLVFYNRTCQCAGNYMGFNCGDCKFGFFGANCNERRESVRRNVFHLSRAEMSQYISYLNLAKNTMSTDYVVVTGTYEEMENGSNPMFANVSVFDVYVWMHYYVSRDALLGGPGNVWTDVDFAHWAPGFLPWHRLYLLHWENDIRKLTGDMSFVMPYWDWRDAGDCDVCTDELMGARSPGDPDLLSPGSVFSSWKVICSQPGAYNERGVLCDASQEGPLRRNPGNHNRNLVPRLPSSAEVAFTLGLRDYDTGPMDRTANMSFRNTMEGFGDPSTGRGSSTRMGMHAAIHVFMNGTMSSVQGSANDPIFLLHHAYIDSLYEQWLRVNQPSPSEYPDSGAPIGHNGDYNMVPFLPLYKNREFFLSSKELGYEYSSLQDSNTLLVESMNPHMENLLQVWPWLLFVGLLGAVVAVLMTVGVNAMRRYYQAPGKGRSPFPEREPLIPAYSMEEEAAVHKSYQTAM